MMTSNSNPLETIQEKTVIDKLENVQVLCNYLTTQLTHYLIITVIDATKKSLNKFRLT